ncbi:PAS domain-containing protein [Neolewinella xylanilytica]|nr:PAS domain-containing protein [Neolewinella xylanilytica]
MALANQVVGDGEHDLLCANLSGRVRYANNSACFTLGYSFEDMLQKSFTDYAPHLSQDTWKQHCQKTISNGKDQIYTYHQNCKGDSYPVTIQSIPHLVSDTNEQLICSIVADAKNSQRYKRMLENVEVSQRIGSFDLNFHDQSILVSENLKAIMGVSDPEELKPSAISQRLSREDAARWNSRMINFLNGYHRMDENFLLRAAAERVSLVRVVMWSRMEDGAVSGITGHYEVMEETGQERMISLEENQRRHIIRALRYTNGRVTGPNGAGRLLDINGKTLFARMKKLNINRDDYTVR